MSPLQQALGGQNRYVLLRQSKARVFFYLNVNVCIHLLCPRESYFGSRPLWGRFPAQAPDPPTACPCAVLEELTPELMLLIQPQKPKLNTTVQKRRAAEMSKRNASTFPNRTFSELSENK